MKKTFSIIGVLIVVLICAALVVPSFIDWNKYKSEIEQLAKTHADIDLKLAGDLSFSVLPTPRLTLSDISAAHDDIPLARVNEIDVIVALWPLLSGRVEIATVKLDNPDIYVRKMLDGKLNWMALVPEKNKDPNVNAGGGPEISIDSFSVVKGHVVYEDMKTAQRYEISGINSDISADSLSGPYTFKGDLNYENYALIFSGESGQLGASTNLPVRADFKVNQNIVFGYSGVIGMPKTEDDVLDAQGTVSVKMDDLSLYGDELNAFAPVEIKGTLSYSPDLVAFKSGHLSFGNNILAVDADVKEMRDIKMSLIAQDTLKLDIVQEIIRAQINSKPPKSEAKTSANTLLPATFTLPANLTWAVDIDAVSAQWMDGAQGPMRITSINNGDSLSAKANIRGLPGDSALDLDMMMRFGSKSKNNAETVLADPELSGSFGFKSKDINVLLHDYLGLIEKQNFQTLSAKGSVDIAAQSAKLNNLFVSMDEHALAGSVHYTLAARPSLGVNLNAARLDLRPFMGSKDDTPKVAGGDDPLVALKQYSLPMDIDADVNFGLIILPDMSVEQTAAVLKLRENSIEIESLSVGKILDSTLNIKGSIGDVRNIKDVVMRVSGQSSDVRTLLDYIHFDHSSLPESLKSVSLDTEIKGGAKTINVLGNVKALGGQVGVSSDINNFSDVEIRALSNMTVRLQHPNTAQAMRVFSPKFKAGPKFSEGLDVYAAVNQDGAKYSLNDLKGNFAGVPFEGQMKFDLSNAKKPSVNGNLKTGALPLDALFQSEGKQLENKAKGKAPWSDTPIDTAWLDSAVIDVDLSAKSVVYSPWVMNSPKLKLVMNNGVLKLEPFTAQLAGGPLEGALSMSRVSGGGLAVTSNLDVQGLNLRTLAPMVQIPISVDGGTGSLTMNADMKGTTSREIISALLGTVDMKMEKIVMQGFDLGQLSNSLNALATLSGKGNMFSTAFGGGVSLFNDGQVKLDVKNGIATIKGLSLSGAKAKIGGQGIINLPKWSMDVKTNISLAEPEGVPPFEVNFTGPLDSPQRGFVNSTIDGFLRDKVKQGLGDLITKELGGDNVDKKPANDNGQPKPEDVIKGVLDGFLR